MAEITIHNVEALLDAGHIEVSMRNGNHWKIRRNGATRRWKRDPSRIYIPWKAGMYGYGAITETDFADGVLDPRYYRYRQD